MLSERYISWLLTSKRGKFAIFFALMFIVIGAIGLKNLGLASDYKIFFDKNDQGLRTLEKLQSIYSKTENVFVMIKPPSDDVFTLKTIQLVHSLTEALWHIPYASRVDSITNYSHSYAEGDDILIEEFIPRGAEVSEYEVTLISKEAPKERELVGKLLTNNGSHTAVNLTLNFPAKDNKTETLAVNDAVQEVIAKYEALYPDHKFYISGIAVMNGAFIDAAKKDFKTLIPLMILCVLIFSGLLLGSAPATGLILVVVLQSFVGALGIAGWLNIDLSAPSISAPIIMFTVIIASSIHILTYVRRRQVDGISPLGAVIDAYKHNAAPIILSHITTIIGFLSMNLSDSPPFRDLGNIVVFGVFISLLQIFTILPFFLSRISFSANKGVAINWHEFTAALSRWVMANRILVILVSTPLAILLSSLAVQSEFDDNLIRYFDESVTFRQHAEAVDKHFSGMYNIDYSFDSGVDNGVFDPSYLNFIDSFEAWLETQDNVIYIDSVLHRIKDLNQLMHKNDDSFYLIPSDKNASAQNFFLYEMSLPFGMDSTHFVSIDKSRLKVTVRLRNMSSEEMLDVERSINFWLQKNIPSGYTFEHSSPALIFSHIGSQSIVSLLKGAAFALVIISFSLIVIFRSLVLGLVSLIPNLLPITAAFGAWYLLDGQVSMGLAGVAAMAIGIVVDDTVHFLFQYLRGIRSGKSERDSIEHTFEKTMSAIMFSSMLLIAGFLLLSTSSFEKNADIGIMTSITILLALLFDMLYLPAIVTYLIKNPNNLDTYLAQKEAL